jgi:hypothetical protein
VIKCPDEPEHRNREQHDAEHDQEISHALILTPPV